MRAGVAHDSEVSLCSYRILHDLGGQRRHRPNDPLFKRRLQSRFSTRSDSCFTFGRFAQLDEQLTTASFFLFAGFSFTPAQPASRSEDPGHRVPTCTCYAHPARLVRVGSPTRRHCDTLCPCPSLAPVRGLVGCCRCRRLILVHGLVLVLAGFRSRLGFCCFAC